MSKVRKRRRKRRGEENRNRESLWIKGFLIKKRKESD